MKTTKRTLALVLAIALVLSITGVPAFASTPAERWQQAQVFNSASGDGFTPYNLKWEDGAKGMISFDVEYDYSPPTAYARAPSYRIELYRNGAIVSSSFSTRTRNGQTWTCTASDATLGTMKDPGDYVFLVYEYNSDSNRYRGLIAKSPVYTVGGTTPTPTPAPAKITEFTGSYSTLLPQAKTFNTSNGDGWTPFNLQWLDGATGRLSVERPAGAGGHVIVMVFRDGVYLGNASGGGASGAPVTYNAPELITTPGEYVFVAISVIERFDYYQIYGEIAKSPPYNHGSAAPPVTMPNTVPGWSSITADNNAFMAIKDDNSLWIWGQDRNGVLGSGGDKTISEPIKLMDGVASAGISFDHSYVLKTDGSLWVSGLYYTRRGDANDGWGQRETYRTHIKILEGVASASINRGDVYAVKTDGSLWAWCDYYQSTYSNGAAQGWNKIMDGVTSAAIFSMSNSWGAVIRTDGSLWSLRASNGTIGVDRKLMDGAASVVGYGSRAYAIGTNGGLWSWGDSGKLYDNRVGVDYSLFGDGVLENRDTPVKVMDGVASVAPGDSYVLAVKTDGSLWGWGRNDVEAQGIAYGPLGSDIRRDKHMPEKIDDGFVYAAAGREDAYGVKADGSLWAWGINRRQPTQATTGIKLTPPSGTTAPPPANPLDSASTWAKAGITSALAKGFVPTDIQGSYTNTINRAEFCRMAVKWLEYKLGKDIDAIVAEKGIAARASHTFSDTTDPAILAAYRLGVTAGSVAPTATAPGQFNPSGQFTRLEAAMMIMNACGVAGMNVSNAPRANFADMNQAASWAHPGINFVHANGIMSGDGTNFLPAQTYSREQSILTFNNVE